MVLAHGILFSFVLGGSSEKPDGTCGYECTADADCGGCGTAGACSCPDGQDVKFFETSCTCISAPADPPSDASDVADSVWPAKWTAQVDAWNYGDFTSTTAEAHGKFYYDSKLGRSRADWTPYTTGKDATQIWVADLASGTSNYYVKSGALCLYFPITDPGMEGTPLVGVEQADWMKRCNDAGFAKYVGREQVHYGDSDEWVDHWSCRLDYAGANQSITFQNWHSLGKGSVPKGLPLRVTGGNSHPDSQKGSPRLNSVWYSNFDTSDSSCSDSDFTKPSGFCIPVGLDEVQEFMGREVRNKDVFSSDFHRRAHYLPHRKPQASDLARARKPKPGSVFTGSSFQHSMEKLNAVLQSDPALRLSNCSDFSTEQLHETQRQLFDARSPALDAVYHDASDTRRMVHSSSAELQSHQEWHTQMEVARPELASKVRDGACHELVMWYTHHLSVSAREEIKERLLLPLLPAHEHDAPDSDDATEAEVHGRYADQVSCAICHVAPTTLV